ncbi:MAG: hypothetical protein EXR92_07550, partial [Gemmatimonadetes bacterium]|nr:hypothetical protein [Gemmatimonadota bacterium]
MTLRFGRGHLVGIASSVFLSVGAAPALHAQAVEAPAVEAPAPGASDYQASPTARAVRITEPITVDGDLDEPVWMTAPAAADFIQTAPDDGAAPTQRTEVRFLYDDDNLYIGAWLWDEGEVLGRLARRDAVVGDADLFAVIFDGYHNHRTAARLATNPSGWMRDEFIVGHQGSHGGFSDFSWDPVRETRSTVTSEGWFVEMAMPFSQLRYGTDDVQTWGLQIERKIRRWGEDTVWAFTPRTEPQGVAAYGHLEGLQGLRQGKRLEILPYTTGRAEYRDVPRSATADFDNPFRSGSDYFGNVGADLKYRLGTNFTSDAAVNPDFGQVELDPAVINLTAFETRLAERRPFFVEGSDIFLFGDGGSGPDAQLLYSRRIGRSPQGTISSESEYAYADIPTFTTILGAAKLTGRTAGGWSLGVLDAVSNRAMAPWVDAAGNRARTEVEPQTNYFAARVRRDSSDGTRAFGVIATAVNRNLGTEALESRLHSSGYSAGIDGRIEWNNRGWTLGTKLAGSRVAGSAEAIASSQESPARYLARPGADHLDYDPTATSMTGFYGTVSVGEQSGAWQGSLGLTATSPGFEVNDLGFQSAADRINLAWDFGYQQPTAGRRLRTFGVTASGGASMNFGQETLSKDVGLTLNATHLSQNGFNARISKSFEAWDDRLTRGGPLTRSPGGWSGSVGASNSPQSRVPTRVGFNYSGDDGGGWRKGGNVDFTVRLYDTYEVILGASLSRSHAPAQYVQTVTDAAASGTFESRYVFAAIDQTTFDVNTRVNVTLTPQLSFELYTQPFVSSGDYLALKELAAPRTFDFLEYGRDTGTI